MLFGFPSSGIVKILEDAIDNFNNYYRNNVTIESITNKGRITDIEQAVSEMMQTISILDQKDLSYPITVATKKNIENVIDTPTLRRFRQSLKLNVSKGDYLVNVVLRETNTGKIIESINSISPNGSSFSGSVFLTTVLPGNHTIAYVTNSTTKDYTLVNYIFTSIPKIIIRVTVSAICRGGQIVQCKITEARAVKEGPGSDVKLFPEATQGQPPDGKIIGNCCFGTVGFGWATGFKSVEVEVGADGAFLKFKVEGNIGRGNTGFVTVVDCCGEATEGDPFAGLTDSNTSSSSTGNNSGSEPNEDELPLPESSSVEMPSHGSGVLIESSKPPNCGESFNASGDGFDNTERGAESWAKYHARQASYHVCPIECPDAVRLDWTVIFNRKGSDGIWHCHGIALYQCPKK